MTADRAALDDLYRRFAPVVYRRAKALLADEQDALDAVQEVFVIVQRKLDTFRGDAAVMTWIYRITTNHCLNQLRARRARERTRVALEQLPEVEAGDDTATALARRDLVTRLLAVLSPREVGAVVHSSLDGMSQTEVAVTLGISERGVRKALARARERAGEALAALEGQGHDD